MTLLAQVAGFMLFEPFIRTLARHTYIKTLQYTIKLWVGIPEFGVFGEHPLRQLNNVDLVYKSWHRVLVFLSVK